MISLLSSKIYLAYSFLITSGFAASSYANSVANPMVFAFERWQMDLITPE